MSVNHMISSQNRQEKVPITPNQAI